MINNVTLIGRLTADPTVKTLEGDVKVANFTLAVEKTYKNKDGERDANFISIVAWRKTAELIEKYLKKGTKVVITGRLQNNNYTNKDGQKVYDIRIMVEDIEFAESKSESSNSSAKSEQPSGNDFLNIPDGLVEELPFS